MKSLIAFAVMIAACASVSALTLERGTTFGRKTTYPRSTSGITYRGGTGFYAVADDGQSGEGGLYPYEIVLSADGKTVVSATTCTTNLSIKLSGTYDLEGVAYDAGSGNVWAADETRETIREYNPQTGAVVSEFAIPAILKNYNVGNYGMESLTISPDGLTLWTANEEALTCDGSRSSHDNTTTVRLFKFTRATARANWEAAGQYAYVTDKWKYQYNYSSKARCGVSDLVALPNGSLLVLERDLSFSSTSGVDIYFGASWLGWKVYLVNTPEWATDVTAKSSLTADSTWTAVEKTLLASEGNELTSYGNFEGMCLGPRLADNKVSILLISDSGDGWSEPMIKPLVLSGLTLPEEHYMDAVGLLAKDSFEEYVLGAHGTVLRGWSGDGEVKAASYARPSVGYPLGDEAHTKVLTVEEEVVRTYDVAAANGTKLEMMVSVIRASKPPAADEARDQAAVYVDADGRLRLFHRMDDGTCGWTVLSDDAFANGDWIRLGVEIDYAKATDGHAYLRVWINGNLCTTAVGRATPGGALGGAWHRAACDKASSGTGKISSVAVTGECSIDDVVLATSAWPSEGIDDVAVDGIPVGWFDEHGLEHDPAAVVPESKCPRLSKLGYTIGDIYVSGIRLEDDEPLKITAISMQGGKLLLEFNAIKVAPDTVYHVMGGTDLGQGTKGFSELMTGASRFDEERQEWRTTWTGDLPTEQKGTGFYFIRATRP